MAEVGIGGPPARELWSSWSAARRLLHGAFRRLVIGQCLGQGADGLAQISFAAFVVFDANRGATPASIAGLLAVTLLPFSVVGPFAGVVIDRLPRRRVLVGMSVIRSGISLLAIASVATGSRPGAFVAVLLLLSSSRFVLSAKGAALPRTVAPDDLVVGNATSGLLGMAATFVAAVGGSTFVGHSAELGLVVAAGIYGAAAVVFAGVSGLGGGAAEEEAAGGGSVADTLFQALKIGVRDLRVGLGAIRANPAIRVPLGTVALHRMLLGAGFVLLVLIADSQFHLKVAGYGLALAVTGVAAVAGTVAAPWLARRGPARLWLPITFLPPAVACYIAGILPGLASLVVSLGVTAFAFQVLKVLVDALVGRASPDVVRGRVFSTYDVLYNVAFVLTGLLMIPLWQPGHGRRLLWLLAAGFVLAWAAITRWVRRSVQGGEDGATRVARRRSPSRRWRWRAAALVVGGLPVVAFPAPDQFWAAWLVLVPLLLLVRAAPTPREAGDRGWWAGAGYVLATQYWLLPVAGPGLGLLAALLGVLWAPWGWAAQQLLEGRPGLGRSLAAVAVLPSGWLAIEAVRSWQSLGGPWALLGTTQWQHPALLASAALGGVWLTTWLIVAVNTALVLMVVAGRRRSVAALLLVTVAALAVGPTWAALRPRTSAGSRLTVAVVQPGVVAGAPERLARQEAMTRALASTRPDLVVWGESSIDVDLANSPDVAAQLIGLSRIVRSDILVNVDARQPDGVIEKSAVLVTPNGLGGRYDKTRLVPFGEYIPARRLLGWLTHVSKAARENRRRGNGVVLIPSTAGTLGPLICFESAFPDMSRAATRLGAQLLVFQTATSTFQGSWAQPQHASLAAVRAVETGRPVIHAALTGTTAAFDTQGRRLGWIPAGHVSVLLVPAQPSSSRTPYDVTGDWMLALSAVVLGGALMVRAYLQAIDAWPVPASTMAAAPASPHAPPAPPPRQPVHTAVPPPKR